MPRLWWLNPWAAARYLHSAATALKDYADQADRCIEMQIRIIEDKNAEIERLERAIVSGRAIIPDAQPHE
jgi:hypothetical protein